MRLLSLCPSNTELAAFLGLMPHLAGVDDFSDWPQDVNKLPRLGPDLSIDMDRVEALKPDLVLASLSVPGMERNIEELEKRRIPHVILNPQSLNDIAADLLTVGKLTSTDEKALEAVKQYNGYLDAFREFSKGIPKKTRIYIEWWPNPIFTPGRTNWLTEICDLAGAENIFSDVHLASVQTSWADVRVRNPEHIGLAWVGVQQSRMNPAHVLKRENSGEVDAVQNGRISLLEEELYCRPSPRLLYGLEKLAHLLHPEEAKALEPLRFQLL
ncbi:ABC transporter substrate-binding protein [Bacillus lacus]|uniref:ABC transporter substrate-binding protein n=1 Tax=Metabacillus lacus TaxID=1983721 RepID=A0A7X2J1Z8_9BACI|nr:cobalamin-binding protein [Metabacillus lacus]MRX73198.1 ABC transporter substrate-binding protein [Metabacillus lacus]